MAFRLEAACLCNTGKVRRNNEDNFYFDERFLPAENGGLAKPLRFSRSLRSLVCLAVFDGMGGENFGECASFAAAERMLRERKLFLSARSLRSDLLKELCQRLNEAVVARAKELCTQHMGSTLSILCFSPESVASCNLGDSRAYRLRGGELRQISLDHVEQRPGRSKHKAPLTQYLGVDPEDYLLEPYLAKGALAAGDQYLLCSDGLTDMLSDEEIAAVMGGADTAQHCAERLVQAALDQGGRDNVTVIVCRIH